jgi:hypothetical protein
MTVMGKNVKIAYNLVLTPWREVRCNYPNLFPVKVQKVLSCYHKLI